jgi:hypothetical protein
MFFATKPDRRITMQQHPADQYVNTETFAKLFQVKPETARRGYCVKGHYMGIRPHKLPNGRLLWPADARDKVLQQDGQTANAK